MNNGTEKGTREGVTVSLENPFTAAPVETDPAGRYEATLRRGAELREKPLMAAGSRNRLRQHLKGRMTVWERIRYLADDTPHVLYQNWGPNLDGASLVTAIMSVNGRDVAVYGHDFTVRAGSMDATNGKKLARLFELAAKRRIPVVGLMILRALIFPLVSAASMVMQTPLPRCVKSAALCPVSCACLVSMRGVAVTCRGKVVS
jgi:hypothetical protein